MKKIVSLLLVLTMVLSLCGCGEKNSGIIENSEKVSNDTTITTTPVEPSIETEPVIEPTEKVETPIEENQDGIVENTISDYEFLDIDYKMCKIDTIETEEAINHLYLLFLDKNASILTKEYVETTDGMNGLYIFGYNTKDNHRVNNYYSNVDCYSDEFPTYIETPALTENNLLGGTYFLISVSEYKLIGSNNMSIDDLSLILAIEGSTDGSEIKRAQFIKENCSIEDMNIKNIKDASLYSNNSIVQIGDAYYSITQPTFYGLYAPPNPPSKRFGYQVILKQLSSNANFEDIVLGADFEILDPVDMQPIKCPDGTEIKVSIDTVSSNMRNGLLNVSLCFDAHNDIPFDDGFLTTVKSCIVKCEINGIPYYISMIPSF